jgi:WD40 repeat protein
VLDGGTKVATFVETSEEQEKLLAQSSVADRVRAIAFSADGNLLAIGTRIGQIELCNARNYGLIRYFDDEPGRLDDKSTPEKLQEIKRAMGSIESLAFSPDGTLLAACGGSFADAPLNPGMMTRQSIKATGPGRVKIWDVKTGELKHDLVGHSHVWTVAFSPDGGLLATAGNWLDQREHGTGVILWNPKTGARVRVMPTEANGGANSVAFSPDSKLIALGARIFDKDNDTSTTSITMAHAGTGIVEWKQIIPGWAKAKAFAPDGQSVAVLCGGHSIRFYETATGRQQQEIRPEDTSEGGLWNDLAIAKEAKTLAIGGVDDKKHGSVSLWTLDGEAAAQSPKPDRETDLKEH